MKFFIILSILVEIGFYSSNAQVILKGQCEDTTLKEIKVVEFSRLWHDFEPKVLAQQNIEKTKNIRLSFKIDKPVELAIQVLGRTWNIYVHPGDSLRFNIHQGKENNFIHFSGLHSAQYNYKPLLNAQKDTSLTPPSFHRIANLSKYKKALNKWYEARLNFLKTYINRYAPSEKFIHYGKTDLKYEYLYRLYNPFNDIPIKKRSKKLKKTDSSNYFLNPFKFVSHNSSVFDPAISIYSLLALTYKNILFYKPNPWKNFDIIQKHIEEDFTGKKKTYLITNLIGVFVKKQKDNYRKSLLNTINRYQKILEDSTLLSYITQCKTEYLKLNRPFPKEVLQGSHFIAYKTGHEISLDDLLKKYKNKAVYIDFWASWCAACLWDIQHSSQTKKWLKQKDVVYLYISLDKRKDIAKWRKKVVENNIEQNQYLLIDDFSSDLSDYLDIHYIPRYIILDSNHEIKATKAPRASKVFLGKLKKSISKLFQKVYHY